MLCFRRITSSESKSSVTSRDKVLSSLTNNLTAYPIDPEPLVEVSVSPYFVRTWGDVFIVKLVARVRTLESQIGW